MSTGIKKETRSILVVSKNKKCRELLDRVLPGSRVWKTESVTSAAEALRMLLNGNFDIVVVDTPLEDDFGVQSARKIARQFPVGVMMIVKSELYDQVQAVVEEDGIITVPKQMSSQILKMTLQFLVAMRCRLLEMTGEKQSIANKVDEMKIIDRAKWYLIDTMHMTEPEAHRYLEKQAMDHCVRRSEMARRILEEES